MARKPKFDLEAVTGITEGPQAQGRKRHNKQRPGEVYEATTPPGDADRLEREAIRSAKREQTRVNKAYEGKPRPGEVLTSKEDTPQDEKDRIALEGFLRLAMERFRLCQEAEAESRKEALDDLKFLTGEQWTFDIKNSRELDSRPCLTMNHLPQFVRQVTNEQRQQRPAIQVNPVGDGADTDTAEILQGMIRHIEVNSDAEIAYDTAFEHCVIGGFGYWRLVKEYVDDGSDEQELKLKRVRNPFNVYFDPAAVEPCYEDARFAFVIEDVPRSEYKVRYPNSDEASLLEGSGIGDNTPDWITRETIRVAEYWYVTETAKTMARLSTGELMDKDKVPKDLLVQNERKVIHREVKCSIINAKESLEDYEWEGPWIPIIPVLGDDYDVDGKRYRAGLIRPAKDPQRLYNFAVSAAIETIGLAPKAPFIGAEGQFENHEDQWKMANTRNLAYLEYKETDSSGKPAGPPQRNQYEPPVQALNLMIHQFDNELKATIGIYDASLGQKGPEQSGKAVLARQKQGDIATLNFSDNLARSIRFTGRQILAVAPHVYDTPRIQRIINPDQTIKHVGIYNSQNVPQGVDPEALLMAQGVKKVFDIGAGRYDVTVSVGNQATKRQEAVLGMLEFIKAFPPAAQAIGDLIAGNSDWPEAKQMAQRLKKMLPQQLQDDSDEDPEVKLNKMQTMLQQAMQQHDLAIKAMQDMKELIQSKQIENNVKLEIAKIDAQRAVAVAEITTKAQDAAMRRKFEFEEWKLAHTSAHDVGMAAMEQQHVLEQGDQGHQQALEQMAAQPQPQNGAAAQ